MVKKNRAIVLTGVTCAVASTPIQFIARVAFTSEQPWNVSAPSVDADVGKRTFIDICTGLMRKEKKKERQTDRQRAPAVSD